MKVQRSILLTALLAGTLAGVCAPAAAKQGLSTNFVEVLVEGVPAGSRYVIAEKLVDVKNNGDEAVRVKLEAEEPTAGLMRPGYEPIPDPGWVGFEPRTIEIKPGETVTAKVVLYAPDDPAYVGKRFQAMLYIHPVEGAGAVGVAVGLKPRLMFSIAPKGGSPGPKVTDFPRKLALVRPYATAGRAQEVVVECEPVVAENHQDAPVTYEFVPMEAPPKRLDLRPGEALMDPAWVEVIPRTAILPSLQGTQFIVRVHIPIAAGNFGKTFVGPLHFVATRTGEKPVDIWNAVRAAVPALVPVSATTTGTGATAK
jgi:hypothetical protein